MNRNLSNDVRNKLSDAVALPKDVVCQVPILTLIGNEQLQIENYRGIIACDDMLIRIQTKTGQIRISGTHLTIEYYTNDEMEIHGFISSIEYM